MRVTADREVCVGAGQCELLAPEVFEVDDDGAVRVLRAVPDDADAVREAVQQCPTGAIGLDGDETEDPSPPRLAGSRRAPARGRTRTGTDPIS